MNSFRVFSVAAAGLSAPLLLPLPVFAHAFGAQYTLPLPISFYTTAAAIALVASFVILSFFSTPHAASTSAVKIVRFPKWLRSRAAELSGKILGLAMLAAALITGFFGSDIPTKNPSLFLFWVGLMLVMTYVSAVVSGVWQRIDPFRTLVEMLLGRSYPPLVRDFPQWLRYTPAVLLFYFILWFELLSYGAGASPHNVAIVLLSYLGLTYFGVALFGNDAWYKWGDFFSVMFGVIGRFAPAEIEGGSVRVSLPGERLLDEKPDGFGIVVFILLILSSTAYDGIRETAPWVRFFNSSPFFVDHYEVLSLVALLAAPFVFLACYCVAIYLMRLIVGQGDFRSLMLRFAYSLVPIAVVYNVAHYFSLVVSEGQNLIPMISDPFGQGLNLFGTTGYVYNPGLIGASTVWYIQVSAIIIGHIVATYIAHRIALREFPKRSQIILGQLPMLALMVVYTCVGLWILSLPFSV